MWDLPVLVPEHEHCLSFYFSIGVGRGGRGGGVAGPQ